MASHEPIFREATAADLPGISRVRTSVRENLLTVEQLRERGITNERCRVVSADSKGLGRRARGEIVAFAIADRAAHRSLRCSSCRTGRARVWAAACLTWRWAGYAQTEPPWPG
jgi:hypothetical protein